MGVCAQFSLIFFGIYISQHGFMSEKAHNGLYGVLPLGLTGVLDS